MIRLDWMVAGIIVGMLIACVIVPPTRKEKALPSPHDNGIFHTDVGCVRLDAVEVPCGVEWDSFNLLASKQ